MSFFVSPDLIYYEPRAYVRYTGVDIYAIDISYVKLLNYLCYIYINTDFKLEVNS